MVALPGASQAGTPFPLAAKIGCCQSLASQAGTPFPLAAKIGCCQSLASQAAVHDSNRLSLVSRDLAGAYDTEFNADTQTLLYWGFMLSIGLFRLGVRQAINLDARVGLLLF